MASSESERVPCPNCGKTYRWKPELADRKVACQACGTKFTFPSQPPIEEPVQSSEPTDESNASSDAGIYDLASDPDEERELPPAYLPPKKTPSDDASASASPTAADPTAKGTTGTNAPTQPAATTASDSSTASEEDPHGGEPVVHVSEAKKAARREEQRKAAAKAESVRTWRDYKLLYILFGILLLLIILYWLMYAFSDAMEEGLHNTMRHDRTTTHLASDSLCLDDVL